MSHALRILLAFAGFLAAITLAHGWMNLGWFEQRTRKELVVGHLPVT